MCNNFSKFIQANNYGQLSYQCSKLITSSLLAQNPISKDQIHPFNINLIYIYIYSQQQGLDGWSLGHSRHGSIMEDMVAR